MYLDKCLEIIVDGGVVDSIYMDSIYMDSIYMDSIYMDSIYMDSIYMDFSKAFASVPHRRLFGKMESYGVKGN